MFECFLKSGDKLNQGMSPTTILYADLISDLILKTKAFPKRAFRDVTAPKSATNMSTLELKFYLAHSNMDSNLAFVCFLEL